MKQIPLFKVFMSPSAGADVITTLYSGYIGEGPVVQKFEKALSAYMRIEPEVVAVNSGTSAEHLIYKYLKKDRSFNTEFEQGFATKTWQRLEPDDEVLSTPLTCTATNWPIINEGLNLRWVDVDPVSLNMSLDALESEINEKTRIITIVHWGGNPIDLDRLTEIVNSAELKYGRSIAVIEDCAHSFGAKYRGKYVGTTGNFGTFSLQAIKHITSVDGGFVTTPYANMARDLKLMRWYGIDRNSARTDFRCETDVLEAGYKYHMNDVNATIGLANLKHADSIIHTHVDNARYYHKELAGVDGLTLIDPVEGAEPSYWLYTLHAERRDDLMRHLSDYGIASSRVHERNDIHTCTAQYKTHLPGVDAAVKTMISIPVGHWVTESDREYIVNAIKKGW